MVQWIVYIAYFFWHILATSFQAIKASRLNGYRTIKFTVKYEARTQKLNSLHPRERAKNGQRN